MRTIKTITILAVSLVASSVGVVAAQDVAEPSTESAGCERPPVEPGIYEGINDYEDEAQAYRVVVPEGYADQAPAPLILFLAAGTNGDLDANFGWWEPYLGSAESVFVVAEQRTSAQQEPATLTALIDRLSAEYCIDVRRIHAMGNSSSAPAAARLACVASDRIASVVAGFQEFGYPCTSERRVPLMVVTGDPDRFGVSTAVAWWTDAYGCESEPLAGQLGSGVTLRSYQGCEADILFYDVEGVGHGSLRSGVRGRCLRLLHRPRHLRPSPRGCTVLRCASAAGRVIPARRLSGVWLVGVGDPTSTTMAIRGRM